MVGVRPEQPDGDEAWQVWSGLSVRMPPTAQVEAERSYVQKLERLNKLTVHLTPCAGHRSCDEVRRLP